MSTTTEENKYPATERQILEWDFFLSTGLRSANINHTGAMDGCDFSLVREIFKLLIARHESLRTIFSYRDAELSQIIHDPESFPFELQYADFSGRPGNDPEIGKWLEKFGSTLFERDGGRMFDAAVLSFEQQSYVIAMTMDHMISDAMSMQLLIRDFTVYYQQLMTRQIEPLPPLRFQMKDYAMWERDYNRDSKDATLSELGEYK